MVSGPILPTYIKMVIKNLPVWLSRGVIPVESPTVPKAEKASNIILSNGKGSTIRSRNNTKKIRVAERVISEVASRMLVDGILRLQMLKSLLPFKRDVMDSTSTAKVVVFIPPPVDPGDAPINISARVISIEAGLRLPVSIVLNPAVRVVTL